MFQLSLVRTHVLKYLEIFGILLQVSLLLQCSCISGTLRLHEILQGRSKLRMLVRHTRNTHPSRRNQLTDAKRLVFCVLFVTHARASYFSVDTATSVTLGVVKKYHSTCVCFLQLSISEGQFFVR